jgi:hypothetical protein
MLRWLAVVIIVAAGARLVVLVRTESSSPASRLASADDLRRWLDLPRDHTIDFLVAVRGSVSPMNRGPDETDSERVTNRWSVAWLVAGDGGTAQVTAMVADRDGMTRVADLSRSFPGGAAEAAAKMTPDWLAGLSSTGLSEISLSELGDGKASDLVSVGVWDSEAPVYVTGGDDGRPGRAGVDDDGNTVVDDLSELGATGSDDAIVTPGQAGFEAARDGLVVSRILNRGAVVDVAADRFITGHLAAGVERGEDDEGGDFRDSPVLPTSEVWLRLDDRTGSEPRRVFLRVN